MTHSHPAAVLERLAAIEVDLGTRMNEYETAAGDRARLIRDWEKRLARTHATVKAPNADSRKAAALVMAAEQDDLYDRLTAAEASFEALKVVTRVLEARASIGMSILKSQGRA
jgi:hypothetical protein